MSEHEFEDHEDADDDDETPFECITCHNSKYDNVYITVCNGCWNDMERFMQNVKELINMTVYDTNEQMNAFVEKLNKLQVYLEKR